MQVGGLDGIHLRCHGAADFTAFVVKDEGRVYSAVGLSAFFEMMDLVMCWVDQPRFKKAGYVCS